MVSSKTLAMISLLLTETFAILMLVHDTIFMIIEVLMSQIQIQLSKDGSLDNGWINEIGHCQAMECIGIGGDLDTL